MGMMSRVRIGLPAPSPQIGHDWLEIASLAKERFRARCGEVDSLPVDKSLEIDKNPTEHTFASDRALSWRT